MPLPETPSSPSNAAAATHPPRVIAVTGGKGGVGKSNIAINLAMSMVQAGHRTLLLDTDLALANVDVLLGLSPTLTLADVIEGNCGLADVIMEGPRGLLVVPAASGRRRMAELKPAEHAGLIHAFSELAVPLDCMVVDTAAGISDSVLTFAQASHDILVTVCNEPTSITDAYAIIKVLSRERGVRRLRVLANMTHYEGEGRELFTKLNKVSERFLDVVLDYAGAIPHDEWLRRSVQRQQAVTEAFPASPSAVAFRELARRLARAVPDTVPAHGGLEFFLERRLGSGVAA